MSLDAAFDKVLQPIREELAQLRLELEVAKRGLGRPNYDVDQLREIGYGRNAAYELLRAHGAYQHGKLRISAPDLVRATSRNTDTSAPSGVRTDMKRASAHN